MPVSSLSFVLLRPCSSNLSFPSTYAFRLFNTAVFLISLRQLYSVSFKIFPCFIVFFFSFSGFACVVVLSYPVRWHFTCLTHEFAIIFVFGLQSQSVPTELASL